MPPETREDMKAFVSMFTKFPSEPNQPKPADYGIIDPRIQYGLTDADIDFFKYRDPEIKAAVDKFTGMDFPVHTIDDFFLAEIAGMVAHFGVDGAVAEGKKVIPRRIRALYRAVCRNHKNNLRGS